jgi:hypothetical protein
MLDDVVISTDKSEYKEGETISITFKNNASTTRRTKASNTPYSIEHVKNFIFNEDIRNSGNVTDETCAHGMPTAPVSFRFESGQIKIFTWDQMERWCENNKAKIERATSGIYRIRAEIEDNNSSGSNKKTIYSNKFKIL